MATFGATASASAAASSVANNAPKPSAYSSLCHRHFYLSHSKVSFRLTPKPKLRFFSKVHFSLCFDESLAGILLLLSDMDLFLYVLWFIMQDRIFLNKKFDIINLHLFTRNCKARDCTKVFTLFLGRDI